MRIFRMICVFCLSMFFLLLAGCQDSSAPTAIPEKVSQVWETMPTLTYGQFNSEKLKVLPWYSGRAEATSKNLLAEIEQGYFVSLDKLYYTDRANCATWVPTCTDPTCGHTEAETSCGARLGFGSGGFLLRNGRIYIVAHVQNYPELGLQDRSSMKGPGIISKTYGGNDLSLEYLGTKDIKDSAFGYTSMLTPQGWFYSIKQMLPDGSGAATSWLVSDSGAQKLAEDFFDSYNDTPMHEAWPASFKGDPVFYHTALGDRLYGIRNGQIYEVDAARYEADGGYLSGSIIRQFRPNDGYYDINIETGEEIFLAPAQLDNSKATIMLPNCIVETTLGSTTHQEGTPHALVLFDGESWRTVALPEELQNSSSIRSFVFRAVASDRLLFYCYGEFGKRFYQVRLDAEKLIAEPFGMVE